jgi:DNA-binding transcriptional LysR family regulator
MRDDRLVEMRVFKAVTEAGSFTAAAAMLEVSQPFVSQVVANLERRLGVQLLHRTTRSQRLTLEGETYLLSCKGILDDLEQAEAQLVSSEPSGLLRISVPQAFGADQIVPLLPAFSATYPQLRLDISLSDALANLIEDKVDVAIRMGRLPDSALVARRLCDLQRVVVAAPAYLARHGRPVQPRDLLQHDCLLWQSAWEHLNHWPFVVNGETVRLAVHGRLRSGDGGTLFRLCTAGSGVMRLAEHLALPAVRDGRLEVLLEQFQARDDTGIYAMYLPERKLVPRIRAFVDFLAEAFRVPPWSRL